MEPLVDYLTSQFNSANEISDEWAASTVDGNFSEFDAISIVVRPEFFDQDEDVQLQHYTNLCKNLLKFESTCDDADIWKLLVERSLSGQKLTILLWYSIEYALAKNSTPRAVKCGVAASCTYFYLCSIKGAQAYHIFNPYLYQRCLDLFRLLYRCLTYDCRELTTKGKGKGKAKGGKKKNVTMDQTDDGTAADMMRIDPGDVRDLLETSMKGLFILLGKVAMSAFSEAAVSTVLLVRDVSQLDASRDTSVAPCPMVSEFSQLRLLSDRAFALMHRLSEDKHSHGATLVLSRFVYPRLAFWGFDLSTVPSSSSIPASYSQWKALIVEFLRERIAVGSAPELDNLVKVLENLYCRCTDRQDYRSKVSESVRDVLLILPLQHRYDFIQRVIFFSRNAKTAARNFTVEIVPSLLRELDWSVPDPGARVPDNAAGNQTVANGTRAQQDDSDDMMSDGEAERERARRREEAEKRSKKKKRGPPVLPRVDPLPALYQCVVRCCVDKSSSVRGRAIIQLAVLLKDDQHRQGVVDNAQLLLEENKRMFVIGNEEKKATEGEEEDDQEVGPILDDSEINLDNLVLYIISRAMEDDKANVRKSALQAIQSFFPAITTMDEFGDTIKIIKKLCVDASLSVRKQAADTMTSLLADNQLFRPEFEEAWLNSVMPMINDREESVKQAASKMITETIISPLLGDTTPGAWSLMHRIEQEDNHRRLLVSALTNQAREGHLKDRIVDILHRKLTSDPDRSDVIWMMIAELSVVFKIEPKHALDTWYKLEGGDGNNKVRYVARVLTSSVSRLSAPQKLALSEDMQAKLSNYDVAAPHISVVFLCLARLLDAVGEAATGWAVLKEFGSKVLTGCKREIRMSIESFASELDLTGGQTLQSMEGRLIRVITTIGEVIQFSPTLINSCGKMVEALKTIMASDEIQSQPELRDIAVNSAMPSYNPTPMPSTTGTRPSSRQGSQGPSQALSSQGPQSSQGGPISSQGGPLIPAHLIHQHSVLGCALFTSTVRAYSVLAIGKFCLMDEKLAKECVPVLVRQLKVNHDHIVRNNIVFVICDLCIRYTLLVDRYSPIIAGCLKDRSTLVRHHTLESLTNLIKEQFIRWEGQIMYRFVSTILDESPRIREYAEFCLKKVLLLQFPTMFYHHFIECLLYFNDVTKKHMPGANDLDLDASLKFSLSGAKNAGIRMKLYRFMLETFEDKDKFVTMAHICEQVLRPIYSGEFSFEEPDVQHLLTDAFTIMSSEEIALDMNVGKGGDDDDEEPSPAVLAAAKKMISETFRKGIIQSIMPPLLEMRTFLIEKRSHLQRGCFSVLRAICRQHREQIDEFLAGDKQLKAEIEYDIQRLEQHEKAQRAAAKKAEEDARIARRRSRRSLAAAVALLTPPATDDAEAMDEEPAVASGAADAPQAMEVEEDEEPAGHNTSVHTAVNTSSHSVGAPPSVSKRRVVKKEASTPRRSSAAGAEKMTSSEGVATEGEEPMEVDGAETITDLGSKAPDNNEQQTLAVEQAGNVSSMHTAIETEIPEADILQSVANNPNVSLRRRRSSRQTAAKEKEVKTEPADSDGTATNFVVPTSAVRKRSHTQRMERENTVDRAMNESVVVGRAISTPKKAMDSNLTFADLNLSAIVSDDTTTQTSQTRKSRLQKSRGTSSVMDTIEERE